MCLFLVETVLHTVSLCFIGFPSLVDESVFVPCRDGIVYRLSFYYRAYFIPFSYRLSGIGNIQKTIYPLSLSKKSGYIFPIILTFTPKISSMQQYTAAVVSRSCCAVFGVHFLSFDARALSTDSYRRLSVRWFSIPVRSVRKSVSPLPIPAR